MKSLLIALPLALLPACSAMPTTSQLYQEAAADGVITPEEAAAIGQQAKLESETQQGQPWWAYLLSGALTVGAALGLGRVLPNSMILGAKAASKLED